jgi:hypothetical protein
VNLLNANNTNAIQCIMIYSETHENVLSCIIGTLEHLRKLHNDELNILYSSPNVIRPMLIK